MLSDAFGDCIVGDLDDGFPASRKPYADSYDYDSDSDFEDDDDNEVDEEEEGPEVRISSLGGGPSTTEPQGNDKDTIVSIGF